MGDWITSAEVLPYLGGMADQARVDDATAAAKTYVQDRRSDLGLADLDAGEAPDDVHLGTILYACLVYNARSSPTGYASYGDGSIDIPGDPTMSYARAMRLIGARRPVAL